MLFRRRIISPKWEQERRCKIRIPGSKPWRFQAIITTALSVILPFGIWGMIAFVWFIAGSVWVMYRNYRYGPPELESLNAFLFAMYFWTATNTSAFTGIFGLSVAINRGVCRRTVEQAKNIPFSVPLNRRRLRPASAPQFPLPNRLRTKI
jgi:hypothetical protein